MTGERKDKDLRGTARRVTDARGGRRTRRAFRPLAWAWLLLLVTLLAPAYDLLLPAGYRPPRSRRTVVIERGQSLHEIALELQRVGVIRSQIGFLVLARAMHLDRSVKAGQYSFRLGMTVPALLRALDRGMYGLNLVTVPEGLMVSETAALIERQVGISAAAIEALALDPTLLDSLEVGAPSLEGWLAPDSYEWLPGTSAEVVLRTMVARTRERVQRATAGFDSLPLGMNAHEVLTLASIVESESHAREERPHIARVYLNRLERGMLLQADPTVGYALGRGPRSRLTFKDLRVVSPYNTYRHEGLPPGPICSPGLAAIEAVMTATPGANDLYFVARGEGRHIFAPTYEQHLANIAAVRGRRAALAARSNPDAASNAEPDSGAASAQAGAPGALAAAKPAVVPGGSPVATRQAPPASALPVATKPASSSATLPVATRSASSSATLPVASKPASGSATLPVATRSAAGSVPSPPGFKPAPKPAPKPAAASANQPVATRLTPGSLALPIVTKLSAPAVAAPAAAKPSGAVATRAAGAEPAPSTSAPLKGTLLLPPSSIKTAASTPPAVARVLPSVARTTPAPDSGRANDPSRAQSTRPASSKPVADSVRTRAVKRTPPATAASTDSAHTRVVKRTPPATAATTDSTRAQVAKPAPKPEVPRAVAPAGAAPAARDSSKAPR